jgi:hypothetical protein
MKITITKRQNRNRVVCTRDDGSFTSADLGPSLPHHDLAHFVAETKLRLGRGFFGNVARGFSFDQLGDKDVIKTLGLETWFAETLAGALGSLETGACTLEQFHSLVNGAMSKAKTFDPSKTPTSAQAAEMLRELRALLRRWNELGDGQALELTFAI